MTYVTQRSNGKEGKGGRDGGSEGERVGGREGKELGVKNDGK